MSFYFLDTNAVVKFYHAEKRTKASRQIFKSVENIPEIE